MPLPKVLIFSRKAADGAQLTRILPPASYEIAWTDNGPETIIQALSGTLDAVVIFVQRKGHRELEYVPCINSIDLNLPVIVISDQDSLALQREIRKHRVFYYLPQPLEPEEICSVLSDAVSSAARKR